MTDGRTPLDSLSTPLRVLSITPLGDTPTRLESPSPARALWARHTCPPKAVTHSGWGCPFRPHVTLSPSQVCKPKCLAGHSTFSILNKYAAKEEWKPTAAEPPTPPAPNLTCCHNPPSLPHQHHGMAWTRQHWFQDGTCHPVPWQEARHGSRPPQSCLQPRYSIPGKIRAGMVLTICWSR